MSATASSTTASPASSPHAFVRAARYAFVRAARYAFVRAARHAFVRAARCAPCGTVCGAARRVLRRHVRPPGAGERGSNVLEMAFIAMFFFIFIAGIVDIGGAFQDYIVAINASREGARTYARLPCVNANRTVLKAAIVDSAVGEAEKSGLQLAAKNIKVFPDPTSYCPANGAEIVVTVQVDYPTLMGAFWNATTLPISAQTRMMFFGTDE